MDIGRNDHTYRWHEDWATIPDTPSGRINGRTHGVAVLGDGRVVVFAQAVPGVLFYDADGKLVESWGERFVGAHGLTLHREGEQESLWLVDQSSAEVCRTDLKGNLLERLEPPPIDQRPEGKYMPTWVDVNPANGDRWIADGYGGSALHRYAKDGTYQQKYTGEEGAGRFSCPHALRFGPDGNLYIADRGNHRIAVYDGEGNYLKHEDSVTHSPCGFDFLADLILVPELMTGVKLIDHDLRLVAELGASDQVSVEQTPEGWPEVNRPSMLQPGQFNSPHGACFAPNGDIYVVEWITGGRITKLEKR